MAGSILQLEDDNFDPETGEQKLIDCIAIASKRYVPTALSSRMKPPEDVPEIHAVILTSPGT